MPLAPNSHRRPIHRRTLDMQAYVRDDGLYEVEARLLDTKPFDFERIGLAQPVPAGQPLHDLSIRLTYDDGFIVRDIQAASDTTPYTVCKQAEATLSVLVGERIARGWSAVVKQRLRGAAGCTHLMEMLLPMATTAIQGFRGMQSVDVRRSSGDAMPPQIDSCYAYGRDREVVLRLWPNYYRAPGHD